MPSLRDLIDQGRMILSHRLDQFCSALECLGARIRGAVANTLGETLGSIVRDAALVVLDQVAERPTDPAVGYGWAARHWRSAPAHFDDDGSEPD